MLKAKTTLSRFHITLGLLGVIFLFISCLFWILFNLIDTKNLIGIGDNSPLSQHILDISFIPVIFITLVYGLFLIYFLISFRNKTFGIAIPLILLLVAFCYYSISAAFLLELIIKPLHPCNSLLFIFTLIFSSFSNLCVFVMSERLISACKKSEILQLIENDKNLPYKKTEIIFSLLKGL